MNEFQPLIDLLSAKHGWVNAIPVWITAIVTLGRIVIKPMNQRIQRAMTEWLAAAKTDPDDAAWWHDKVLTRTWYRLGAFMMDLVTSVKLPTHADFHALTLGQTQAPPIPVRPVQNP